MTIRWKRNTNTIRFFTALSVAAGLTAAHGTAAQAQGIVREPDRLQLPFVAAEPMQRTGAASAAPVVFNAATLPIIVLEKTLGLSYDQKAAITALQSTFLAKRQALISDAASSSGYSPIQTTAPRPEATMGEAGSDKTSTQSLSLPTAALRKPQSANERVVNAQSAEQAAVAAAAAEEDALARRWDAEQALSREEQAAIRRIRALLSPEQITRLKTAVSDAQMFAMVGLPVDLLAQITLSPDERADVTMLFRNTRRQLQRAAHDNHDDVQKAASIKALAALTAANKATAEAYLKAHPSAPERSNEPNL